MHVHFATDSAEFASAPLEARDDLLAGQGISAGNAIVEDRGLSPGEGNASEPRDLGFAVAAVPSRFEAGARPVRGFDGGPVADRHLGHRRFVLACKRFSIEVCIVHLTRSRR